MNVLSIFDGMSCGQLALQRAGVPFTYYYASEIDKYAIKVACQNFPDTIQLGDVKGWREWPLPGIDLLIGGSPCQGFSKAGKRKNFADPRSVLIFEFIEMVYALKPRYFLLENVVMKKEHQNIISGYLGIQPIKINSALVSAQKRSRLYWTNIPGVTQPDDRGIVLRDILEDPDAIAFTRNKGTYTPRKEKSTCISARYWGGLDNRGARTCMLQRARGKNKGGAHFGKSPTLTGNSWEHNHIVCRRVGDADGVKGHDYNRRVYSRGGKSPTIPTSSGGNSTPKVATDGIHWRKLTPIECERLQTVPDNYTAGVSNTQRYKMLGNGWTVDVIAHILKNIQV